MPLGKHLPLAQSLLVAQEKRAQERRSEKILRHRRQPPVVGDIVVLFNTFIHFKWVSKKSVFNAPLLGWNMRLNGYVPINRGSDASREKCMDKCREWLAKGSSVLFFPEGTRATESRKMLPFKVGAFKLAVESGRDVLPIVIQGSIDAIPKDSALLHRKARMTLEVLPPVSIDSFRGNASSVESAHEPRAHQKNRKQGMRCLLSSRSLPKTDPVGGTHGADRAPRSPTLIEDFVKGKRGGTGQKIKQDHHGRQPPATRPSRDSWCVARNPRSQAFEHVFLPGSLMCDKLEEKILGAHSAEQQRREKIRRQKRKRSKRAKEKMLSDKHFHAAKKDSRRRPDF
jgi:1-acyl-sn-glycerol-3-phosphate acyltransferase